MLDGSHPSRTASMEPLLSGEACSRETGARAGEDDETFAMRQANCAARAHGSGHADRHRLYAPARRLLQWGDVQHPRHAEPQDLFLDLALVAACSQVGRFAERNKYTGIGALGVVAFGAAALGMWQSLLFYRCRFQATSLAHATLDMVEGLCFAAAAHNMISEVDTFQQSHIGPFVLFVLGTRLVLAVRMVELALVGERGDPQRGGDVRQMAMRELPRVLAESLILSLALCTRSAATLFVLLLVSSCVSLGWFVLPLALVRAPPAWWGAMTTVGRCLPSVRPPPPSADSLPTSAYLRCLPSLSLPSLFNRAHGPSACISQGCGASKAARVPVHIEFVLGRMGELVLLTLGECVLSLVLARQTEAPPSAGGMARGEQQAHGREREAAFACTFVLLSSVVVIYHHANPTHRHHHASRRDALRGLLWTYSHWPLVIALISVAVGLKELCRLAIEPVPARAVSAFGASLAVSLLVLALQELLHAGPAAYALAPVGRASRLAMLCTRALLAAALGGMCWLPASTHGCVFLGCASAVTCASGVLLSLSKASASEHALWEFADSMLAATQPVEPLRRPSRAIEVATGG
jgi:hypothetical protein